MKITVDTFKFKAALASIAKQDVRYYLQGVYLTPDGHCHATDGHQGVIASKAFTPPDEFNGLIVELHAKLPTKCNDTITFDTDTCVADYGTGIVKFATLDAQFPNLQRVIPQGEPEKIDMIGIDVNLLKNATKVFQFKKYAGVRLTFHGPINAIKVTHTEHPDILYVVMPCRE